MNTRGLVELIVLNIGLKAGVLNNRIFSIMVIMCLFTTFLTSPILLYIYPSHLRKDRDIDNEIENEVGRDEFSLSIIVTPTARELSSLDIGNNTDNLYIQDQSIIDDTDMIQQIELYDRSNHETKQ